MNHHNLLEQWQRSFKWIHAHMNDRLSVQPTIIDDRNCSTKYGLKRKPGLIKISMTKSCRSHCYCEWVVVWCVTLFATCMLRQVNRLNILHRVTLNRVLRVRTIVHARNLWKLARSCKQLRLLCPPDPWNRPGTALLNEFPGNLLSKTIISKCRFIWNKGPVNIWP